VANRPVGVLFVPDRHDPTMSIARCVNKIMDRIAPLVLAEKWDNVSSTIESGKTVKLISRASFEVGLLLGHHIPSLNLTSNES
jgi:hypothetical protein